MHARCAEPYGGGEPPMTPQMEPAVHGSARALDPRRGCSARPVADSERCSWDAHRRPDVGSTMLFFTEQFCHEQATHRIGIAAVHEEPLVCRDDLLECAQSDLADGADARAIRKLISAVTRRIGEEFTWVPGDGPVQIPDAIGEPRGGGARVH